MTDDQLDARLREVESRVEDLHTLTGRVLDRLAEVEEILCLIQQRAAADANVLAVRGRLLEARRHQQW